MTKDEALAMDLALAALERLSHADSIFAGEFEKEITAIKQVRLAPVQEPVALIRTWHKNGDPHAELVDWGTLEFLPDGEHCLYAAPPAAQRTWVGLIHGVRVEGKNVVITVRDGNDAARELCCALLKEKNT
jgi:hypothetical protein